MYCPECGKEIPDSESVCRFCGTHTECEDNKVSDAVNKAARRFSSPLFLAVCVFATVSALIPAFRGTFNVLHINFFCLVAAICAWSVFICAAAPKHSRFGVAFTAVVTRIFYVAGWVLFGIIALATVTMATFSILAVKYPEKLGSLVDRSLAAFEEYDEEKYTTLEEAIEEVKNEFGITDRNGVVRLLLIVAAVILFISALMLFTVNFCIMRHVDAYTDRIKKGTADGNLRIYDRKAAASFLVLGVVPALGGLSLLTSGLFTKIFLLSYFCPCIAPALMFFVIGKAEDRTK